MNDQKDGFRAGFVALIGRPNVGKSTLVNALVGEKVAIVSPKPQTTRTRIQGIVNRSDSQVVLVDTPGISHPDSALRKAMRRTTGLAVDGADASLLVVDCSHGQASLIDLDHEVLNTVSKARGRPVVALNKVDALARKELYQKTLEPAAIVPISALRADGLERLMNELVALLPESAAMFPPELHTDQAERFLCAELVREQLLLQLREEVPYAAAVAVETFEDERREDGAGLVRIEGRIYIERESQKGIVVGKGGTRIKDVSQASRLAMEELLGCKVFLRLTVHVDPDWTNQEREVQRFGYGPDGGGDSW